MTHEEAISNLQNQMMRFAEGIEPYIALQMAIDSLRECRWIPVTERLPESNGVYIVSRWFSDGCESAILTDACYFDGTSTWHNDNRINHSREYVDKKIVAWMPLPKSYGEGGEQNGADKNDTDSSDKSGGQ